MNVWRLPEAMKTTYIRQSDHINYTGKRSTQIQGHTSFKDTFASSYCWHSWKVFKNMALNKKYIVEKDDSEVLRWHHEEIL